MTAPRPRSTLGLADLVLTGLFGLRARRLRASLSALGIAIGVASLVAVVGVSASSQAGLLAQIDQLGTGLVTVTPGTTLTGAAAQLPATSPAMIRRLRAVQRASATALLSGVSAYQSEVVPAYDTRGLSVRAVDLELLPTLGLHVLAGRFIDSATAGVPMVVLGDAAATRLGVTDPSGGREVVIHGVRFAVLGVLEPVALLPQLDSAVLVGFPAATRYLTPDTALSEIYVRTDPTQVAVLTDLLPRTVNPEHPEWVSVARPSDLLAARAQTVSAFTGQVLGVGTVGLLVGAIGIANVMYISVLERRPEIGLRCALGATGTHIALQFTTESALIAAIGAIVGLGLGVGTTVAYTALSGIGLVLPAALPPAVLVGGTAIGAVSGLYPAIMAARLSPTTALRSI